MKLVAVEPFDSQVLAGQKAGPHKIQGIGAGFVPEVLDARYLDLIMPVKSEDAYAFAKLLPQQEGILVGISSGATISVAVKLANETGKDVVVIAADNGERYLSVEGLF